MSLFDKKCEGPYVKPCIEYADDRDNIRLYQWCAGCLRELSERLNHQPIVVNTPIYLTVDAFTELARRWDGDLRLADLTGKYYGTHVLAADGEEVIEFWTATGQPSDREKRQFGEWTQEKWNNYVCDPHWECEADYRAAVEFIALAKILAGRRPTDA